MELTLKAGHYSTKINYKEVIKNFFDLNIGSVLVDILQVDSSLETKAFTLLFNTARNTCIQLAQKLDQDKVNSANDLIIIATNFETDLRRFLEQEVVITQNFFKNVIKYNPEYLRSSYKFFENFLIQLNINIPLNYEFIYYKTFRQNLSSEYQLQKSKYSELLEYFNNPISEANKEIDDQIEYYVKIKSYCTRKLQPDIPNCMERLIDLYIEPGFLIFNTNLKGSNINDFVELKNQKMSIHSFINDFFFSGVHFPDLRENYNMLFLLGQPGQGKTSLCYKLVYDYLNTYEGLPHVPIYFIKIRELNSKDFINNPFLEINGSLKKNIDFNSDKCILILDGLDEAYMGGGISDNDLRNLYLRLKTTSNQNSDLKLILTSRFNYLKVEEACLDGSLILQLKEFTNKQILNYANKFRKFYPNNSFIKNVKEVLTQQQHKHIHELLSQPVLIYFIALSDINLDRSDSKAIIYNKIFDTLARRAWDKNGQLDFIRPKMKNNPELYQKQLRDLIRNLAFEIFQSPNFFITLNDLLQLEATKIFVKKCFNDELVDSPDKLRDISKYLLISFYFQESKNNNNTETAIEFFHNSIWEYLTAEYMWDQNKKLLLQTDPDDEGSFINVTQYEYFALLNKLVGNKDISHEISDNLTQIIENENFDIKKNIKYQSNDLFQKLLNEDFLLEYRRKDNTLTSIEKTINIFELFWTFYWYCHISINDGLMQIDYQLEKYLFRYSYNYCTGFDFKNVEFTDGPSELRFSDSNTFENVRFMGELGSDFYGNKFFRCRFDVYFHAGIFSMNEFYNVSFEESSFSDISSLKKNKFMDCTFNGAEFSESSLNEFLNDNEIHPSINDGYLIVKREHNYGITSYTLKKRHAE